MNKRHRILYIKEIPNSRMMEFLAQDPEISVVAATKLFLVCLLNFSFCWHLCMPPFKIQSLGLHSNTVYPLNFTLSIMYFMDQKVTVHT
jgi:hypothetical protein